MSVIEFSHNFCESIIFKGAPEIFNSISSLFITLLPFIYGFPKVISFRRITYMLMFTGLSSFYYHFYLSWLGKQLDELGMIFALYTGIFEIIYLFNKPYPKFILYTLDFYFILFIAINTVPQYDIYFPILFSIPCFVLSYYIRKLNNIIDIDRKPLIRCAIGLFCWILSELYCNYIFFIGHSLWHILFPMGIIIFINNIDKAISKKKLVSDLVIF